VERQKGEGVGNGQEGGEEMRDGRREGRSGRTMTEEGSTLCPSISADLQSPSAINKSV